MVDEEQPRRRQREAFGRALTQILADARVTQKELSERLGGLVGQSTISEWKNGQSEPASPAMTFAVEEALGVRPGELSGFLGYVPVSAAGTLESALLGSSEIDENFRTVLLTLVREIKRQTGR
jgi:transcriptional regulator with XRE-family HTH domain